MPEVRSVARVLTDSDELLTIPSRDGHRPNGLRLGDILTSSGGQSVHRVYMTGHQAQSQALFRATGDPKYRELAEKTYHDVSIAHLIHLPVDTRVLIGVEVRYTEEEARLLPPDPTSSTGL